MGTSKGRLNVGIGVLIAGFLGLTSIIPIRIAIAFQQAPEPQAILILDGTDQRVQFGATVAALHPDLPIWISGNSSQRSGVRQAFEQAGVADRVQYDLRATDTVTHFTTLVEDYGKQDIHHVYLVTSDYHMPRATIIATLVFGSHGIAITPISAPFHSHHSESWLKNGRDGLRSLLWLVTGRTGARFNPRLQGGLQGGSQGKPVYRG